MSDRWIFAGMPAHLRQGAEREFEALSEEEREAVRYALARELPQDTHQDTAAAVLSRFGHEPEFAKQAARDLLTEPAMDFRKGLN